MDENRLRFGVGVLVISAIGIGIILTFLFGAFPSVLQRDYSLSVVFDSAEGIGANTPVVRDGVRIGRVSSISLRDQGGVLVTLAMDATKQVSHSYIPRIGTGNFVTGDATLEFVRGKTTKLRAIWDTTGKAEDFPEILKQPYTDGEYISYGENSESLFEMQSDLQQTFEAIRDAGSSIAVAAESINKLASGVEKVVGGSDSKIEQVADEAVQALREFNGAMTDIREIVNNPVIRENLEESVVQLPEVLKQAKETLEATTRTFDSFERVGEQFEKVGEAAVDTVHSAQRTVKNVEQFTEPLATHGDELVNQVLTTMARLDSTLTEVDEFGKALNNKDGSVRLLLDDQEMYWKIRRTVENIESATARIRPILDDVRVFTDKVARDPRQLGVRGALSKRPSGLGLK
ncbi:MlaD family protein [Rubripirellula sp.]|nr:MlaD family protein [Rubripirellula sp.]MDB4633979.1 MlaD family protein [Rubripirellula sp.]